MGNFRKGDDDDDDNVGKMKMVMNSGNFWLILGQQILDFIFMDG